MKTSGIIYSRTVSETVYEFNDEGEEEVVVASVSEEVAEARIASLSEELGNIKTISEFETFDPETSDEINFDQSSLEDRLNKRFANTSFSADKNEKQSRIYGKSEGDTSRDNSSWGMHTKNSFNNDNSENGRGRGGGSDTASRGRKSKRSSFETELDRRYSKRLAKKPGLKSNKTNLRRNYQGNKKGAVKKSSKRNSRSKSYSEDDSSKSTKREKAAQGLSGFSFVFGMLSSLLWGNTIVRFVVAFVAGILVFGTIFASQF